MSATLATQSRIASLIASFSVRLPASTRLDLRAEQAHAEHVQRLALHVVRAHVDDALEAEQCADGRRRHAVLAGAGLGDDAALAHPLREQGLAERVVDLVRAGMRQILALEEHAHAPEIGGEPRRIGQRRGPPDEVVQEPSEPRDELLVVTGGEIRVLELRERRHERLGHEPAAERAEVAACVRVAPSEGGATDASQGEIHRVHDHVRKNADDAAPEFT